MTLGQAFPSSMTAQVPLHLVINSKSNCSFKIYGPMTPTYFALVKEAQHTGNKVLAKIVSKLEACHGVNIVQNLAVRLQRLAFTGTVLVTEAAGLKAIKSVVSLAAPQKDFKISKETLVNPIYIGVANDLFKPELWDILSHWRDTGLFQYCHKTDWEVRFIRFWSSFSVKPSGMVSDVVNELRELGVHLDIGRRGGNGAIKLNINHVATMLSGCLILEFVSILVWVSEIIASQVEKSGNTVKKYRVELLELQISNS